MTILARVLRPFARQTVSEPMGDTNTMDTAMREPEPDDVPFVASDGTTLYTPQHFPIAVWRVFDMPDRVILASQSHHELRQRTMLGLRHADIEVMSVQQAQSLCDALTRAIRDCVV